ncbi:hypothetical protein JW926_04610 [Candidatus Sumerlaeota bacterium]|nr:hypothetical protein [Candidatus Sumerlaeota bacterium]
MIGIPQTITGKDTVGGIAKIIAPAIILFILGLLMYGSYSIGMSRVVYFVNGLSKPYKINIKGKEYALQPNHYHAIKVGEGRFEYTIREEELKIKPQTITIKTPFLTRMFLKRLFIVNPDTAAVLLWEKIYYAEKPGDAPPTEYKFYNNSNFYVLPKIDYAFIPYPESVSLPDNKIIAKTRISLPAAEGVHPLIQMKQIEAKMGKESAIEKAKTHLLRDPENADSYLQYLLTAMEGKAYIELASSGLSHRPILVEWHRMYQNAKEKYEPQYDLEPEYRSLLEADPENPALQYLLGRVVTDQIEAVGLFQKSVSGAKPLKRGYYAMAMHYLNSAQFEMSVATMRKMMESFPCDLIDRALYFEILAGAKKYDDLISEYQGELKKNPNDLSVILSISFILITQGKVKEADNALGGWFVKHDDLIPSEARREVQTIYDIEKAYLTGDLETWSAMIDKNPTPERAFDLAITRGNMEDAKAALEKMEEKHSNIYLLLYIAMKKANREDDARKYLGKACEILRKEIWEERRVADCLEGIKAPDPTQICSLTFAPRQKIYILIALGMAYPEQRKIYFDMARKLNTNKSFPHLFFESILAKISPQIIPQ